MRRNLDYVSDNGRGRPDVKVHDRKPDVKTGRVLARPVLRWLDLLKQVSAAWLERKGKKPWRICIPARSEIQQENRPIGPMTPKALTGPAEPCFPPGLMSVSGALVSVKALIVRVRVTERIGGRRGPFASAPT